MTRRAAALAVSQIVQRHALHGSTEAVAFTMAEKRSIDSIMLRLLSVAVIDPSARVRIAIFDSLASSTALDLHIGQPESLRDLFIAFNDEVPLVRSFAIRLSGRLLSVNPAYISPALRKCMLQLITDLDTSPDAHQREEGAYSALRSDPLSTAIGPAVYLGHLACVAQHSQRRVQAQTAGHGRLGASERHAGGQHGEGRLHGRRGWLAGRASYRCAGYVGGAVRGLWHRVELQGPRDAASCHWGTGRCREQFDQEAGGDANAGENRREHRKRGDAVPGPPPAAGHPADDAGQRNFCREEGDRADTRDSRRAGPPSP